MPGTNSNHTMRVLIVDDTPKNIQVLGTILKQENYQINIAINGKQAIEMAQKVLPDIILLDIMMPEMDGFEACKILKEDPLTQNIPIIFLSAKNEAEDIIKGLELGASDYVTKPFNAAELLARVNTHLSLKKNKEELEKQNIERKVLLQVIAHDLTNPLVGIQGIVDLLKVSTSIEEIMEFVPFLATGVENALDIVELIRTMQSLDNAQKDWELSHIPFKKSVDEVIQKLNKKYNEKDIKWEINVPDDLCVLVEKTSFINSVLYNVMENAIKFSNLGGSVKIDGSIDEEGHVQILISDKGIGMSEKLLSEVFLVEAKTNRPGTMGETGTGYGLPLVKKFMDIYSGSISIESDSQKDKSFTIVKLLFKKGNMAEVIS